MAILSGLLMVSGDAGHNSIPDTGAVGIRKEDDLTKEVWLKTQARLRALGYRVTDCTPWNATFNSVEGSLAYRVKMANSSESRLHLCIHFNSGGGSGVEAWVIPGGNGQEYGEQICKEIARALQVPNRGVKDGSKLFIPKYTTMSCVLIECLFVDSEEDMNKYDGDKIAEAIVKGVTGESSKVGTYNNPKEPSINIKTRLDIPINPNAEVINDWFYVRDTLGNIIPGRVDIGDKIEVLDISYSRGLILIRYPTPKGTRTEYIKNVSSNIRYFYEDKYKNGSTKEVVYQDSKLSLAIGYLDPFEKATPLYRKNGVLHIAYSTNKGKHSKSGYVKYEGGFKDF